MANIVIPFAAVSHQPVPSVGFNNNFTEVATKFNTFAVQTDVAKIISVSHQWNAAQNFAGDLLFTDNLYDIGKAGATRPRNLFLAGTLVVGGTTTHAGDILLASDNALDLGATALRLRDIFAARSINLGTTPATVGGVRLQNNMNVAARNVGNTADIVLIKADTSDRASIANSQMTVNSATGAAAIGGTLTVSGGLLSPFVFSGSLSFTPGASKIVPGATSLSLRNNADTADNVLVSDAGNVTVRLGITAGGSITAPISATAGSFHATPSAADPAISTSDGDIWILTSGAFKAKLNGSVRTLWHSGMVSTGYAAWTGTLNRASVFDQSTATLANVAQRLAALQNDLMTAGVLST